MHVSGSDVGWGRGVLDGRPSQIATTHSLTIGHGSYKYTYMYVCSVLRAAADLRAVDAALAPVTRPRPRVRYWLAFSAVTSVSALHVPLRCPSFYSAKRDLLRRQRKSRFISFHWAGRLNPPISSVRVIPSIGDYASYRGIREAPQLPRRGAVDTQ